jgi:Glycosyltransferase family 87
MSHAGNGGTVRAAPSLALRPGTRAIAGQLFGRSLRERVALAALAGLVVTGSGLALGSASTRHSFPAPRAADGIPGWVAGPLANAGTTMTAGRFIVLLAAMWLLYLVVLALADAVHPKWAVATIVTLTVVFTVAPPLLSGDIFSYVDYARLGALHDLNPYRHGPIAAHADPVFPFVRWRHTPSIYGPLFTIGSYPIAFLGLAGALWSFKALAGAASLGCVALVWRCARRAAVSPVFAALLVGLNPILVVYAVGGGHNDLLALLPLTAGIAFAVERRAALGGASLVAALATKATAGLALPFMLLGSRQRAAAAGGAAGAALLFGAIGFAIFGGAVLEPFKLIAQHQRLYFAQSIPPHIAVIFGAYPRSIRVQHVADAAALAVLGVLAVRAVLSRDWVSNAGWALFAALATSMYLLEWYTIWLLPFAAVARDRRLVYAALSLGTFVVASHFYYLSL